MDSFFYALKDTRVLVCSGGLPEGVPVDFYARLIGMARNKGIRTILDTSGKVLEEGLKAAPFMIKPNRRELSGYCGRKLDNLKELAAACSDILSHGVEFVVASLGSEGALLVSRNIVLKATVPPVDAVNTIGSGDSTVAGCAAALARGYSPEEMLRLSMACAVANTRFMEIGVVTVELVEKYMEEIRIERMEVD
jgi:1-phosphofructokinase/tagatose 6-phosphate kinase